MYTKSTSELFGYKLEITFASHYCVLYIFTKEKNNNSMKTISIKIRKPNKL